ncbi:FecCD family ABC transporter permease [Natronosporangium hydrolyticum]|uniref:FecCD family ABC transporter permease n=1 Tax=Natronosporangium hydrolyticum TaxID=2811111 RepID=UPI001EFA0D03|nr:iron chelate uptake ABC transporter family permease subunit [Natronosporangium hydrolyticum]
MTSAPVRQRAGGSRRRPVLVGVGCLAVAAVASGLTIATGDYPLDLPTVLQTLVGRGSAAEQFVVFQLRLPRVVTGLLVGAALGLAGAVFQSVTRNALGSPDVLGFTQGAAAGALLAIVVAGGGAVAVAGAAMAGSVLAALLIYALAWRHGVTGARLVLIGVGLAATLTGVNGYLLTRAQLVDAARAVRWLTGSLDGRGWSEAMPLLLVVVVAVPVILLGCGRGLRALELGDEAAVGLGVSVGPVRLTAVAAAVLLCGAAAAAAGPVAFVALTAPHVARQLTRSPGPNLLPALCAGAALLVTADLVAQRLVPGRPLPVGVLTALLGGGYLVWLLILGRREGRL